MGGLLGYDKSMTAVAKALVEIVDALPEEKAREVVDFARFLQHQSDDAAWEFKGPLPHSYRANECL